MADPTVPVHWKIASSSHSRFPVDAGVKLEPIDPEQSRFRFLLIRQGQPKEALFEERFPEAPAPGSAVTFRGQFDDAKRLLVTTVCPGKRADTVRCLCGQIYDLGPGKGDGATGVWVAEEQKPPIDPGGEC